MEEEKREKDSTVYDDSRLVSHYYHHYDQVRTSQNRSEQANSINLIDIIVMRNGKNPLKYEESQITKIKEREKVEVFCFSEHTEGQM